MHNEVPFYCNVPFLYDITRMIGRSSTATPIGVDRVEIVWLKHLLSSCVNTKFLFTRKDGRSVILPRIAGDKLRHWSSTRELMDPPLLSRLAHRFGWERQALRHSLQCLAETRFIDAKVDPEAFQLALRQHFPRGGWYINHGQNHMNMHLMRTLAGGGLKRMMMLHDTIPLDFPQFVEPHAREEMSRFVEIMSRECDLVVCNSHATEADLRRHSQIMFGEGPQGRIVSAHLGVDKIGTKTVGQLPRQIDSDRPFFVILGTIEPRKNHALLLDVWEDLAKRLLPQQLPQLVIAGKWGWMINDFRSRLEAHALYGKSIFVVESPDDATVAALMQQGRALLMPSFSEGYGLPVVEAISAGMQVIAAPHDVYREIVGEIPVYCALDDIPAWSQAVERLSLPSKQPAFMDEIVLPLWDDHFASVFAALGEQDPALIIG